MSLLILSAKALGTIIGYTVNLEAIRAAKKGIGALLDESESLDGLDAAIEYLENSEFDAGIKELKKYCKNNERSQGYRVVKELYAGELEEIHNKVAGIINNGSVMARGPAYQINTQTNQLISELKALP